MLNSLAYLCEKNLFELYLIKYIKYRDQIQIQIQAFYKNHIQLQIWKIQIQINEMNRALGHLCAHIG